MKANILDRRGIAMVTGALLLAIFAVQSALAQTPAAPAPSDIFVAEGVPVDVTAASVTDARERGLIQGRVNGLRMVLERIVARDDLPRVPTLSSNQIIEMVRDFSIADERSSAVRYLAKLTVRFDPAAVRGLLRRSGIPFTEIVSKPLVVVPVLRDENGTFLWNEPNPWRGAWARVGQSRGLVPIVMPTGDAGDTEAVNADQALAKDQRALTALASHYDAGGVLVAAIRPTGDGLQITLTEIRGGRAGEDVSLTYAGAPGQSRDDVFTAAAQVADQAIEDSWRRRNRITSTTTAQITALIPVADLKEFLAVRTRLAGVPLIEDVNVQAMTRDRAQVTLSYVGDQGQLSLAMAQQDLSLAQQNGVWLIELLHSGKASGRVLGQPGPAPAQP